MLRHTVASHASNGVTRCVLPAVHLVRIATPVLDHPAEGAARAVSTVAQRDPPHAQSLARAWNVPEADVVCAFDQSLSRFGTQDLGVGFLMAKRAMRSTDEELVAVEVRRLLQPPPGTVWPAIRARLDRIARAEGGDLTWAADPPGWQTFDEFVAAVPGWDDEARAFVFHRARGVSLPRRHEKSGGLCYLHAPLVLQRYLVSLRDPAVGMIDMTVLLRQHVASAKLATHLFSDAGGSSAAILKWILEPGSSIMITNKPAQFGDLLKDRGPGLVSHFQVHEDFAAGVSGSFDGRPVGGALGLHAMVLIGARVDAVTGKRFFLLQNWWKSAQFVEVSETYLAACGATLSFVESPQTHIPTQFPAQPLLAAENEFVDAPERMVGEHPAAPPKD